MFSGLRLRLTLLYLLSALGLVVLVGGAAYQLVGSYFRSTTDLALKHRMVQQLQQLGAPISADLAAADRAWLASRSQAIVPVSSNRRSNESREHEESEGEHHGETHAEEAYDAELATIFVLHLSSGGQVLYNPQAAAPPFAPDQAAFNTARARGDDLRTVTLPDGRRTRVLTYRLDTANGPAAVQLGRLLTEQDLVLERLLVGLLALGGVGALLIGLASWWLAGRSIRPAREAWERQQSFVANASHELRTPLTLVRATTEVALRDLAPGDTNRRMLLGDVLQECDHMSRLIEDLLLLSRLDAGKLQMTHEPVALPDLLADVARQIGRRAEACGVRISLGNTSGVVWGDPTRIRQILLILLDNALRHTASGGTLHLAARTHGRHTQITVADTGAGIAPEHLPHIFERFYRADSAHSTTSGSGLGLSIAKALAEAQGGQIAIESQLGKGTSVLVELPSASLADQSAVRVSRDGARTR